MIVKIAENLIETSVNYCKAFIQLKKKTNNCDEITCENVKSEEITGKKKTQCI